MADPQHARQAETHDAADTDSGTSAIHHTLGTGASQAAAGNHTHAPQTLFNDAEGDPADVSTGSASDGTSAYASRRDHAHHISLTAGEILVDDAGNLLFDDNDDILYEA